VLSAAHASAALFLHALMLQYQQTFALHAPLFRCAVCRCHVNALLVSWHAYAAKKGVVGIQVHCSTLLQLRSHQSNELATTT
jgi:hypothetical protein